MGKLSLYVTILYRPVSPLDGDEVEGGADVPIDEGGADAPVDVDGAHVFRITGHTEDAQVVVENELEVDGPIIIKEHILMLLKIIMQ